RDANYESSVSIACRAKKVQVISYLESFWTLCPIKATLVFLTFATSQNREFCGRHNVRCWRILAMNVVWAFFGMPNRAWSMCEETTAYG
ncbi:hypothetical protein, partial [Agrobacterium tumefaciens]|uniref:hypothetical protein n=1 Tax=Agrobacterium tumefaciens TaxID=358 RepID=UPI00384C4639